METIIDRHLLDGVLNVDSSGIVLDDGNAKLYKVSEMNNTVPERKIKVLIIDDSALIRNVLKEVIDSLPTWKSSAPRRIRWWRAR